MKRILAAAVLAMVFAPAARAQAASPAQQELIKLENAWGTADQNRDVAMLDRLYATEYLFTDADGKTWTKAQDIASVKDPTNATTSFKLENLSVRLYGDAFAVVTGSNTIKSTFKGKDVSGKYMFTDAFVKRDGRWQCVATQSTKVK